MITKKQNIGNYQRTISNVGDVQEGSLRAQKRLKEQSKDALEQTLKIIGRVFLGFSQHRKTKALNRARFPFEICPRTETSIGK